MILDIKALHVYYGGIHALKGVSLSIAAGEIVALLGANGAGKSTLLRAISGLVPVKSGQITYQVSEKEKLDIQIISAHQIVRYGLCHVPEGRAIFGNLKVMENLEVGAYCRKKGKDLQMDFARVFRLFPRLAERRHQAADTLSGGEQQMLAIGRALMSRPRLLMLDEPSLGLSPILVKNIFRTIVEINREGIPILLVEQNAHLALKIAQRGYILETGVIKQEGSADQLANNTEVRKYYLGESAAKEEGIN